MPKFGKRSQERLKGVNVKLVNVLNKLIKIMDVTIIEGVRSEKRQAELLKKGATKVKYSKHMEGKAVDLAPYPVDWEDRERQTLFAGFVLGLARNMGIRLRWGGDWDMDFQVMDNRFDDFPHFEVRD